MKVLLFATHPIQYYAPIYRKLSEQVDLTVIYCLQSTNEMQAKAGFNVEFEWDIPLLEGYKYEFAENKASKPSSSSYFGVVIGNLKTIMKKYNPDKVIVQGWFPYGMIQVLRYCKKHNIETLSRGDSTLFMKVPFWKRIIKTIYIKWVLKHIDKLLLVGEQNRMFFEHYGAKKERFYYARHCINTSYFQQQFEQLKNVSNDLFSLGFAGKLIEKKRPLDLVEAIGISRHKEKIELIVMGSGPLEKQMLARIKELNITFQHLGFINQSKLVSDGYAKMDALVLPSGQNETWGLVVNECMTGGIPAILSNSVGCAKDLIIEGETGYTFDSGNIDQLAEKIDLMIETKEKVDFNTNTKKHIEKYALDNTVQGIVTAIKA